MRRDKFVPDNYYHIYNRTIFKMPEFKNNRNCERLSQAFLLANWTESTRAFQFLRNHKDATIEDAFKIAEKGERLVDILCYVIMPDHYHLLLRERKEGGISQFVRKCDISIAKYINISNERKGTIFESRFQSKYIDTNEYLLHLSLYIHLNPLDFIFGKNWRSHGLKNWQVQKKKLLNYPWSSLNFFLNNQENKIISGTEIILDQFINSKEYDTFLREWSEESLDIINKCVID